MFNPLTTFYSSISLSRFIFKSLFDVIKITSSQRLVLSTHTQNLCDSKYFIGLSIKAAQNGTSNSRLDRLRGNPADNVYQRGYRSVLQILRWSTKNHSRILLCQQIHERSDGGDSPYGLVHVGHHVARSFGGELHLRHAVCSDQRCLSHWYTMDLLRILTGFLQCWCS